MTDLVNENVSNSSDAQSSSQPAQSTAPVQNYQPQHETSFDKVFTQDDVNKIVGKVRAEDKERYTKRPETQYTPPASNLDEQKVKEITGNEVQRLRDEWAAEQKQATLENNAKRVANEFFTKLSSAKEKYQDFETVTSDLDYQSIPAVVELANMFDNTVDVMYDIAKNPIKIGNLQQLIMINPKLAYNEMKRLSESIKDNEKAKDTRLPNEPLSQLLPSNSGSDSGNKNITDYKRMFKG